MNKIIRKLKNNAECILLSLFVLSFLSNTLSIYIGLTITPCIIIGAAIAFYNIKNKFFFNCTFDRKLLILLLLFLFTILIGTPFSYNALSTIKILAKIIILLFIFWQFNNFYISINKQKAIKTIELTVITYAIVSLILYITGILILDFNFNIENTRVAGVMIDRMTPRLISLASNDPNITSLYFSIILAFLLSKKKTWLNIANIIFYLILDLLTFSRGGLIALILVFAIHAIIYIIKYHKFKLAIILTLIITTIFCCIIALNTLIGTQHTITGTIINRFSESFSDGGSGRLIIWEKSIKTFLDNPILGIGANNTLQYNTEQYHIKKYTHNNYLEILSETGFIGAIAFILLTIQLFRKSITLFKKNRFPFYILTLFYISCFFLSLVYTEIFIFTISPLLFIKGEKDAEKK